MELNALMQKIVTCIEHRDLSDQLAGLFFPFGEPLQKETALWDYKQTTSGDKLAFAELARDIAALHNSYGGYIFLGVSEPKKDEEFQVIGFDRPAEFVTQARGALDSYVSNRIDIDIRDLSIGGRNVCYVYVPQRKSSLSPVFLTRNGPEKRQKPIFFEKTTYFREHDRNIQATVAGQWEFLNSDRNPRQLLSDLPINSAPNQLSRIVPQNLPDRNLICNCLFGREEILSNLWAWMADELEPVRLLAGAGGRGKTSIAYEFASRLYKNAPLPIVQVLWVSAKRLQFRAERNEYVELPVRSYSSPIELLRALCEGTAALVSGGDDFEEESEYTLQKKLRESLKLLPSFVIVDDVDSLSQDQQRRVFELVQQISSAGSESKFLITTRANYAFSETQCIQVVGLDGDAYRSFVEDRLARLGLEKLRARAIKAIHTASGGSPLWTESILRLMRQGLTFDQALSDWAGKPGEDARAAALKKELEALSPPAKRLLYAASILGESSRAELIELTKIGKKEFEQAIVELQALFLVDAPKLIADEPRFSVHEATALAVTESAAELVADHKRLFEAAREFSRRVASSTGKGATSKIGSVVNQTIALLSANDQPKALATVENALKANPKNPDLLMLKGRCLRTTVLPAAVEAFAEAHRRGQRKSILFDMWHQALVELEDHPAVLDITNLALDAGMDGSVWLPLRARASVQIGLVRRRDGNAAGAIDLLRRAARDLSTARVACKSSPGRAEAIKQDMFSINDVAWSIASSGRGRDDFIAGFDLIRDALTNSDFRVINARRLVEITKRLVAGVDLSADSPQARASRSRLTEAVRILKLVMQRNNLRVEARSAYEDGIGALSELTV